MSMKMLRPQGNEMKKMFMMIALVSILITPFALASSAFTQFEGSGDLYIKTTIGGSTDTTEIHTGCEACCCCPGCEEDYEGYVGYQFLSTNPFISATETSVDDGCIDIVKNDIYERNGEVTYTETHTGFSGTGTASSFLFRDEDEGHSYQYANSDDYSFVFFHQGNIIDEEFDYYLSVGGVAEEAENTTAEMNTHFLLNSPSIIVSDLKVECDPLGTCYTTFLVDSTDVLTMNAYLQILEDVEWYSFVDVNGDSYYIIFTESNNQIDFGFVMEVG